MDQNSLSNRLKTLMWPAVIAVTVTVTAAIVLTIVVKSPQVASTQAKVLPIFADILVATKVGDGAFDTPFFNGKEEPLTLNGFKGQGVVLNFWATWCLPCVREMPALDSLAAKLKARGVVVVAVSEDRKAMQLVPEFYASKGIKNLDLYYDSRSSLSRKLGIEGLPTTVLITADGRAIGSIKGALEWDADSVVEALAKALGPQ